MPVAPTRRLRLAWHLTVLAAMPGLPVVAQGAPDDRAAAIIRQLSLDEKLDELGGLGFETRPLPNGHVPAFVMSDGAVGLRVDQGVPASAYAAGIGLAASWDSDLARAVGASIGREARARGIHVLLGPGLNLARSATGGRNFEYLGEDPFLAARLAVPYIEGVQSQGVSATAKHFVGNDSEYDRHRLNSVIDERTLREIYLPPFEAAVREAHVGAIITGYNKVNGAWMNENAALGVALLRDEWGFDGLLMTDWVAGHDAVAMAKGGTDLEMPVGEYLNAARLGPAVASGALPVASIDAKIRHILAPALRFGWLDRPQRDDTIPLVDSAAAAAALRSARESIVLLSNPRQVLPLDRGAMRRILVVGPDAWPAQPTGGGSGAVAPIHAMSLLEGLTAAAGPHLLVQYERGLPSLRDLAQQTRFYRAATGAETGLTLDSFDRAEPEGPPASVGTVAAIDAPGVTWSDFIDDPDAVGARFATWKHHRSARRWTGWYEVRQAGRHVLALLGSGEWNRNRVLLDGQVVIDDWRGGDAYEPAVTRVLAPGRHKIVVEEAQAGPLGGKLQFAIAREDTLVSARARALAAGADAVIVAVGFDRGSESEGADRSFSLPVGQDVLVAAMAAANPRTIVTVTAGGAVDMSGWADRVAAILYGWYGGEAAGTAMAEALFGDLDPGGHLPVSIVRRQADEPAFAFSRPAAGSGDLPYREGVFVGYRGLDRAGTRPLFAFGHGLSYTRFRIANLAVPERGSAADPAIDVSFDVTNTGMRDGAAVAQLYVADAQAPLPPALSRPPKELKGFARVVLRPGETRRVSLHLDRRAFAWWDTRAHRWTVTPGRFGILVGQAADAIDAHASVTLR